VPLFRPFPGIRYDLARVNLGDVISPPYDVIDDRERARLAARSPYNAVLVDLPVDQGGEDRYAVANRLFSSWQAEGVLVRDGRPTFTVYRMSYRDDAGVPRHTTGVIGALDLRPSGADILPHEETTPKARSDRLDLLRACRANLSAIWGLSLAKGLTDLLPVDADPVADVDDDEGVRHAVWIVDRPEVCDAIAAAVTVQPVVIADGHHRYETCLTYLAERERSEGRAGDAAATLAYVVELVEDELTVRAIHRLLNGLPPGFDLVAALEPWFEPAGPPPAGVPVTAAMIDAGALCAVLPGGEVLLRPRPDALADARDLDSARLDVALASLPAHDVTFQHGPDNVRRAVETGEAQAGVLLRPASVAQIEATAHGGERMPPKTTFFHPKLRTGLVFRDLGVRPTEGEGVARAARHTAPRAGSK
jgi:uncharacterized protein (DUF1015 family)